MWFLLSSGEDYEINSVSVPYHSGTSSPTGDMRIMIKNDTLVEGHEVLNFTLKKPTVSGLTNNDGARLGDLKSTIVIIRDDDGECFPCISLKLMFSYLPVSQLDMYLRATYRAQCAMIGIFQ